MRDYFNSTAPVRFVYPIDGDCMNIYDGVIKDGYLTITVKVAAPADAELYIDEQKASFDGEYFTKEVPLKTYRTTITAKDRKNGTETAIAVYKLEDCVGKYRISMDDNILFLADLTQNQDVYTSLFDNPYLNVYKKAHDLYGAKIHINIYYEHKDEQEDRDAFSGEHPYFNLTMMTDKYKEEWKANSDWLKLSFHARSNFPDAPYKHTTMERIDRDIELVHKEIIRFAGPDSLPPVTTLHWGASNEAGTKVLRNRGYKGLNGYFTLDAKVSIPSTTEGVLSEDLETFLEGICQGAQCTMHISLETGRNGHHIWEAIFRALGIALGRALYRDPARKNRSAGVAGAVTFTIE